MNKTFGTMKTSVGNRVQDTSAAMLSLIGDYINDRLVEIYRRLNILGTERVDYQFTTTGGTEDYILPDDFGKEVSVVDLTNNRQLSRMTIQEWVDKYGSDGLNNQGTIYSYIILDQLVRAQPSSASVATVVSSSASDTSNVYVRGIVSSREDSETITLNGTTSVPGSKSFDRIISVSKSATTVGRVTVTTNSGAVTVAILAPNAVVNRIRVMRLVRIPSNSTTIEMTYIQKMLPLINTNDYPIVDCDEVLEAGASADAWRYKKQFNKAQDWEGQFEKRLMNLAFDYESQPNQVRLFNPQPYSREIA